MAVNFEVNAPMIQLERRGLKLSVHLTFDFREDAKRTFEELQAHLEAGGQITLTFFSEGSATKQ